MSAGLIRITLGAPLALLVLTVFLMAMLIEWSGDLVRTCLTPENHQ